MQGKELTRYIKDNMKYIAQEKENMKSILLHESPSNLEY